MDMDESGGLAADGSMAEGSNSHSEASEFLNPEESHTITSPIIVDPRLFDPVLIRERKKRRVMLENANGVKRLTDDSGEDLSAIKKNKVDSQAEGFFSTEPGNKCEEESPANGKAEVLFGTISGNKCEEKPPANAKAEVFLGTVSGNRCKENPPENGKAEVLFGTVSGIKCEENAPENVKAEFLFGTESGHKCEEKPLTIANNTPYINLCLYMNAKYYKDLMLCYRSLLELDRRFGIYHHPKHGFGSEKCGVPRPTEADFKTDRRRLYPQGMNEEQSLYEKMVDILGEINADPFHGKCTKHSLTCPCSFIALCRNITLHAALLIYDDANNTRFCNERGFLKVDSSANPASPPQCHSPIPTNSESIASPSQCHRPILTKSESAASSSECHRPISPNSETVDLPSQYPRPIPLNAEYVSLPSQCHRPIPPNSESVDYLPGIQLSLIKNQEENVELIHCYLALRCLYTEHEIFHHPEHGFVSRTSGTPLPTLDMYDSGRGKLYPGGMSEEEYLYESLVSVLGLKNADSKRQKCTQHSLTCQCCVLDQCRNITRHTQILEYNRINETQFHRERGFIKLDSLLNP